MWIRSQKKWVQKDEVEFKWERCLHWWKQSEKEKEKYWHWGKYGNSNMGILQFKKDCIEAYVISCKLSSSWWDIKIRSCTFQGGSYTSPHIVKEHFRGRGDKFKETQTTSRWCTEGKEAEEEKQNYWGKLLYIPALLI